MDKTQIEKEIDQKYSYLQVDRQSKPQPNLLKFNSESGLVTWYMFFDNNGICNTTKEICDYSLYNTRVAYFDKHYVKKNKSKWLIVNGKRKHTLTIQKDKWFFTILTK
jgi:hypothetical protein